MRYSRKASMAALVLVVGIARSDAAAETRHAGELKGLRAANSGLATSITFVNRSSETVKVYWLDFEGKRKLYETVPAGQQCHQPTFVLHPWVVTDARDHAWGLYFPDAQPRTVEIHAPRAK
jgi:von Hippel-Lindau disease tumor supressor